MNQLQEHLERIRAERDEKLRKQRLADAIGQAATSFQRQGDWKPTYDDSTIREDAQTDQKRYLTQYLEGLKAKQAGDTRQWQADQAQKGRDFQQSRDDQNRDFQRELTGQKAQYAQDLAKIKSQGDWKKNQLGAEQQKRYDNVRMGLKALKGMDDALAQGGNTFELIGDDAFTLNRTAWEEAVGRMQSGGAITEVEAERFKTMVPGVFDSKEIQTQKLKKMYDEMQTRLQAFEHQQPDPGLNFDLQYGQDATPTKKVVKKMFHPSAKKIKLIYDDGSEEIIDAGK